jgi:hypothetical protein
MWVSYVTYRQHARRFTTVFRVLYLWLYNLLLKLRRFFSFLIFYTDGRALWTGNEPASSPLPTHRTQTQNKRTQTSISRVGFKPTVPVFERARTVRNLDRAATVMGSGYCMGTVKILETLHYFHYRNLARIWGPLSQSNGYWELYPWGLSVRDVKPTTHLHLTPMPRIAELYLHSPYVFIRGT